MGIKEFAKILHGRERGKEINKKESALAKELGYVIIFGCSDDLTIIEGAIDGEIGSYDGADIYLSKDGLFEKCDCNCKYSQMAKLKCNLIKAIWAGECDWTYETSISHEKFEIFEDGQKYCQGIVFHINDLNEI